MFMAIYTVSNFLIILKTWNGKIGWGGGKRRKLTEETEYNHKLN